MDNDINSIRVLRGVPADAGALAELAARTFADAFAADNRAADLQAHLDAAYNVDQLARELADPAVTTLLAYRDERLIAYAQIRRKTLPACVTATQPIELQRFYVDREAHGTGVAMKLMTEVQRVARRAGAEHLWLGVWERNARALAFYRKAGFHDVGSHFFDVGSDRQTDRVLVAVLPEQAMR